MITNSILCLLLVFPQIQCSHSTEYKPITQQDHGDFSVRDRDLNGKVLRIAAVEISPWVEFVRDEKGRIIDGGGFCFEIINTLKTIYNFTALIKVPQDNAYGSMLPNGSWNGMIAMLLNDEADVGVGAFSVTYVRQRVIDFTIPFYEDSNGILIPPPFKSTQFFAFAKPFKPMVWLFLAFIVFILSFTMWVQAKIFKFEDSRLENFKTNSSNGFLFIYGILLSQSGIKVPNRSYSCTSLAAIWCLCAVVFIHAYTGTLVSFLTFPNIHPLLTSLDDLPTSSLSPIVWKGSDLDSLFMQAKEGIYRVIGDRLRMKPQLLIQNIGDGPGAVLNGSYAYMNSKPYLELVVESDYAISGKCRLSLAKNTFNRVYQAFAIPKKGYLRSLFNRKMLHMIESGLVEHWKEKFLSVRSHCDYLNAATHAPPRSLSTGDLFSAFIALFIGISLALLAFIIESIFHKIACNRAS